MSIRHTIYLKKKKSRKVGFIVKVLTFRFYSSNFVSILLIIFFVDLDLILYSNMCVFKTSGQNQAKYMHVYSNRFRKFPNRSKSPYFWSHTVCQIERLCLKCQKDVILVHIQIRLYIFFIILRPYVGALYSGQTYRPVHASMPTQS